MSKRETIHKELDSLYKEGIDLAIEFQKKEEKQFQYDYQRWYTKALKAVASLAADRHAEFRNYYEIDPKRKSLGYGTYVIQDYLKGVAPNSYSCPDFDTRAQVITCFFNQLTILNSIGGRVDSVLANIEGELYA
jgi:thiamine pyrophosphokinase